MAEAGKLKRRRRSNFMLSQGRRLSRHLITNSFLQVLKTDAPEDERIVCLRKAVHKLALTDVGKEKFPEPKASEQLKGGNIFMPASHPPEQGDDLTSTSFKMHLNKLEGESHELEKVLKAVLGNAALEEEDEETIAKRAHTLYPWLQDLPNYEAKARELDKMDKRLEVCVSMMLKAMHTLSMAQQISDELMQARMKEIQTVSQLHALPTPKTLLQKVIQAPE